MFLVPIFVQSSSVSFKTSAMLCTTCLVFLLRLLQTLFKNLNFELFSFAFSWHTLSMQGCPLLSLQWCPSPWDEILHIFLVYFVSLKHRRFRPTINERIQFHHLHLNVLFLWGLPHTSPDELMKAPHETEIIHVCKSFAWWSRRLYLLFHFF